MKKKKSKFSYKKKKISFDVFARAEWTKTHREVFALQVEILSQCCRNFYGKARYLKLKHN